MGRRLLGVVSLAAFPAPGDFVPGLLRFNRVLVLLTGVGVAETLLRRGGFIGVIDNEAGVTVRWVAVVMRPGVRVIFVEDDTLEGVCETGVFISLR